MTSGAQPQQDKVEILNDQIGRLTEVVTYGFVELKEDSLSLKEDSLSDEKGSLSDEKGSLSDEKVLLKFG